MGLVYEGDGYHSAYGVKKFDAEKFDRFIDNLAHDIDRYSGDARALENGYGKYYHNSTYVGKAANASKEFIDRKQFEKFHVESKDIQKELFNRCLGVRDMFEARVDPSPKARIDSETLELSKHDYRDFGDKLEYEGYDIECIARELESEFGKYGEVTQPNYRRAMMAYDEFCGHGGFWDKCERKFEDFNEDARQYMKRSMIKEHSNDLQKNIKLTAVALEGMTVFKTDVQGQSVWLNTLNASNTVVNPSKLVADIQDLVKLSGIKYNKEALVDANIIKKATELALLNCKSKDERAVVQKCSASMMAATVVDPATMDIIYKIVMGVAGFFAESFPLAVAVTVLVLLICYALEHKEDIERFVTPKEKEENGHIIDIPPQEDNKPIIEKPTPVPQEKPSVTDIPSGKVEEKELGQEIFPKTPADEEKSKITTIRGTLPQEEKAERYKDYVWYENEPDSNLKGRQKNKIGPHIGAEDDHVVYQRDPVTGEITHYKYYEKNPLNPSGFDEKFGYDKTGRPHRNKVTGKDVATPHVHDPNTPGELREPSIDEIPG